MNDITPNDLMALEDQNPSINKSKLSDGVRPTDCNWFYPDPDFEMGTYFETSCNNAFQFKAFG